MLPLRLEDIFGRKMQYTWQSGSYKIYDADRKDLAPVSYDPHDRLSDSRFAHRPQEEKARLRL